MSYRKYYSARTQPNILNPEDLYQKLCSLYLFYKDQDYFKGLAGITRDYLPDAIQHKALLLLHFQPFPIAEWPFEEIDEAKIFDVIEFLHDHIAKPGQLVDMRSDTGWNYQDYEGYDETAGREEYRALANQFLSQYGDGFELTQQGEILRLGNDGTSLIYDAGIVPFDEKNVDSKVKAAIATWRSRRLSLVERKNAIRDLADVFEWLKKTGNLSNALNTKDEAAIFEIANKFALRHHNPDQKRDYDEAIWFSWIFHFYLATYHAVVRLLTRSRG